MNKKWRVVLIGLIVAGALLAVYLGWQRHSVEEANKQVEVVLDWAQVKELARREGLSEEEILKQFQGNISGVLFKEPTLNDLMTGGAVLVKSGAEMLWEMQAGTGNGLLPVQKGHTTVCILRITHNFYFCFWL